MQSPRDDRLRMNVYTLEVQCKVSHGSPEQEDVSSYLLFVIIKFHENKESYA